MTSIDLACGTGRYTHLLSTLGASSVTGYDISTAMIAGARAAYPTLTFSVADCSKPLDPPPAHPFDLIFAGWFLNYAGTEPELVDMFKVIEQNLTADGRFVGITTNVNDADMHLPKPDFYGLDILVLDPGYVAPLAPGDGTAEGGEVIGIKARVVAQTEPPFGFDVFQFKKGVYERCAREAGLWLRWRDPVVPDDERKGTGFWDRWLERPTFVVVEAGRV